MRTLRLFKVVFLTLAEICPRFFENYHHLETFKQSQVPSERNHNYSWPDLSRNFMINTVSFLFWSYQKSCNDHYVCLMKGISSVRLAITFFWILPIFFLLLIIPLCVLTTSMLITKGSLITYLDSVPKKVQFTPSEDNKRKH